jgi:hypothetical protein
MTGIKKYDFLWENIAEIYLTKIGVEGRRRD